MDSGLAVGPFFRHYGLRKIPQLLKVLRGLELRSGRPVAVKSEKAPGATRAFSIGVIMPNNRCQYTTGLDLREGMLFALILVVWLASVWALFIIA